VLCIADDYGTTGRPLISMEMWKIFTYPHLKRFIDVAHENGAYLMLHSCGYQVPFLEHYVAAGLDVLQSFQPKAGNDFAAAYAQYGDRLAFATGIDIQRGESMSPQELRAEILRNYHIGKAKGRHILGTTHMMQYTMPIENVRAVLGTVREIQAGHHG
jgi:uroporphyrinogen decarboxylase